MSLYENNIEILKKELPYIKIEEPEKKLKVQWKESAMKEQIMEVETSTEKILLNSQYEAELWAKQWVEQFENVNYRTKFFLLGIGNGMYLKALHEKYPDNLIVCCEIYPELEDAELHMLDFKTLMDKKILLVIGNERRQVYKECLSLLFDYSDYNQVVFCSIPNYKRIDEKLYESYRAMYVNNMENMFLSRNTIIADEEYRRESFLNNLFIFPESCALSQLVDNMKKIDVSDRVAIVVSAGPSLDKNIGLLKYAKNKALLIAVDAAAKPMIKAGVCPDIIVTIDPIKDESVMQQEELLNCALVACMYSHYKLTRQHRGALYFPTSGEEYTARIYEKCGIEKYRLASGGSVANNAYSLAVLLGFNTIVLVGQDLAYPNGKIHAQNAIYGNCMDNNINIADKKKYFEVEANDGGKVLTEANMDAYRRWFEEQAARGKNRIINATEGGAKIKGTEIMPLSTVLDEFCNGKEKIDFESVAKAESCAFSDEQRREIFEKYLGLEKELNDWEMQFKEGIKMYQRLDSLNRKGKYNSSEYKKLVEKTGELTKKFNDSDVAPLLGQWGNREEYEVLDTLVDSPKNIYDEVKTVIDGSQKMFKTYINNSRQLKEKWKQLLLDYELQ